jgi:Integral membrane protein TerC family
MTEPGGARPQREGSGSLSSRGNVAVIPQPLVASLVAHLYLCGREYPSSIEHDLRLWAAERPTFNVQRPTNPWVGRWELYVERWTFGLGIDNIVFLSILAGKLPAHQQAKARQLGLSLALSFLLLIGVTLVAEGFHKEIPKGYVYFAMAFFVGVELLNLRVRARSAALVVQLRQPYR